MAVHSATSACWIPTRISSHSIINKNSQIEQQHISRHNNIISSLLTQHRFQRTKTNMSEDNSGDFDSIFSPDTIQGTMQSTKPRPEPPKPKRKYTRKQQQIRYQQQQQQDTTLSDSIDSFLAGDYAHPFATDAPAPHPGLGPGETVNVSLRALRELDLPHKSHGAAVFMRFCIPLTRGERWGGGIPPSSERNQRKRSNNQQQQHHHNQNQPNNNNWAGHDQWKDLLRGALSPSMLARKLRSSSQFSGLLDWTSLDVTEGASNPNPSMYFISGSSSHVAYVNAALFFGRGLAPTILHFVLKKIGEVWFVDTVLVGSENDDYEVGSVDDEVLDEFDGSDGYMGYGLL